MMLPFLKKRHPPVGSRPGTLVTPESPLSPRVTAIRYDRNTIEDLGSPEPDSLAGLVRTGQVTWIDIQGLGDESLLRTVAAAFSIHPLALEDVVNVPQRPKFEEYRDHLLAIARMTRGGPDRMVMAEQVSLILGKDYVLSFQERYGDTFDPVRVRLAEGIGPIRESGADYLAYALLDAIIDGYYPVLDDIGDRMTQLELRIMEHQSPKNLDRLNELKYGLMTLQRGIAPQREALTRLLRDRSAFISDPVTVYLRDTLDHAVQLTEALDNARELAASLLNTYLSLLGNRTNDVMKVLTIMASIFIPLTFLAGLYGMNFEQMPELHLPWAYPLLLAVMAVTAIALLLYFRWKGWLGSGNDDD